MASSSTPRSNTSVLNATTVQLRPLALLLLSLLLIACGGPGFEEGAYVDPRYGTTYEFGPGGEGRLLGAVGGPPPTFTYQVERDQVVTSGGVALTFRRIDRETLERNDGARLVLRK